MEDVEILKNGDENLKILLAIKQLNHIFNTGF